MTTMCDESWLWDILLNLLGNAKKFTHSGTITLHIAFQGGWVVYKVIDTGVGVASSISTKLFQAFQTTDKLLGTGIGLYGCRLRVEKMGGTIDYIPNRDRGSIFCVRIPHVVGVEFSQELSSYTVHAGDVMLNTIVCRNLRVLLVDDDSLILNILKHHLQKYLVCIDTALSIAEAMELLDSNSYNCVITDGIMHGSSGISIVTHCIEQYPNTYVCLLSGSASLYNEALEALTVDKFTKPIVPKTIVKIIAKSILHSGFLNVLIVDDDATIQTIMRTFCKSSGLHGHAVSNGEEALVELRGDNAKKYTLVLLDLNMPIMNGVEFLKRLDITRRNLPYICICSARCDGTEAELSRANEKQLKPLRASTLLDVFDRAMKWRNSEASSPRQLSLSL
jgi:CheY-like chemotaxis protein